MQIKWSLEFSIIKFLKRETDRKSEPTRTWIPWNPVVIKNVDPYTESEKVNLDSKYSIAWQNEKIKPNEIVIINPKTLLSRSLFKNAWCDQVIEAPEDKRIIEFNNGISIGWKISIPLGGHLLPISIFGETLLLKKAQKNLIKNITSEAINIIILNFNILTILLEWFPWRVDSLFKSRHHKKDQTKVTNIIKTINRIEILFIVITEIIVIEIPKRLTERKIGQGLAGIIWNGFEIFCIISEFH